MDDPFQSESRLAGLNVGRLVMNILTGLILVATLCLGSGYVYTYINPQASFNPYPPPTLPATLGPPTPTNTPAIYLPTEIPPSATPRPLPTAVPTATETPAVSPTPPTTATPEPATAVPGAQFQLQEGDNPAYTSDTRGCEHMGVGGWVFDNQSTPAAIINLAVRLSGDLAGTPFGIDTLTGAASARFGIGAYYIEIAGAPAATDKTLWLQVFEPSSGLPLSDKYFLTTFATCDKNLIFVNWKQTGS